MASELGDPFCFDEDVDKSFQLVFPQRTVDLVARDAEEAALLARGFQVNTWFVSEPFFFYFSRLLFPRVARQSRVPHVSRISKNLIHV